MRLRSMPFPVPRLMTFGFFGLWADEEGLRRFRSAALSTRPSTVHLALDLVPLQGFGAWRGSDPLEGRRGAVVDGPVLLLTRSRTRPASMIRFMRAEGPVVRALSGPGGPIWADGFMDGVLTLDTGTLSIWRSVEDAMRFAYADGVHREAAEAQREGGWFSESWFGRFGIAQAAGCWPGLDRDALAVTPAPGS